VVLHTEGAAIDLRGAQLDQLQQLLVQTGLAGELAECEHHVIGVGRDSLEVFIFAAGV
jgi:hypothetical protein